MGLEFNVELEFSRVTKPQAREIASEIRPYTIDAQPHGSPYVPNPVEDSKETNGTRVDDRRISVFLDAETHQAAKAKAAELCIMVQKTLRYQGRVFGVYEMNRARQ